MPLTHRRCQRIWTVWCVGTRLTRNTNNDIDDVYIKNCRSCHAQDSVIDGLLTREVGNAWKCPSWQTNFKIDSFRAWFCCKWWFFMANILQGLLVFSSSFLAPCHIPYGFNLSQDVSVAATSPDPSELASFRVFDLDRQYQYLAAKMKSFIVIHKDPKRRSATFWVWILCSLRTH